MDDALSGLAEWNTLCADKGEENYGHLVEPHQLF